MTQAPDLEVDAIAACVGIIEEVRELGSRRRVVEYLMDRYGPLYKVLYAADASIRDHVRATQDVGLE
jgi:hypothetical protein